MDPIKTPYTSIYNVLMLNRSIVLGIVAACLLTSVFSLFTVYKFNQKMLDTAFAVNTDGSVLPLKLVDQNENLEVEALSHLELFHSYFYGIDESNYEKHMEKALWLGDATVDNVYRQKKADGLYNRLMQYSLVQKIIQIESVLTVNGKSMVFKTETLFEINRGTATDRYQLITTGNLIRVDRHFPNNTHGLLITNFFENSLKKLTDATR